MIGTAESLPDAQPVDPALRGWIGRTRRAFTFATRDRDTVIVALAGFLLRGGIVLLLLPSAVLPSAIGVAGVTGVDAFGIDGRPTPWLFEIAAIASAVAALWLLLAFILGSLIDVWLIDAALDRQGRAMNRHRALPDLRILLDMAGIRAVCIVPVAGALAWAGSRIYETAYNELTAPTNLTTPLVARVIQGAADAVVVVGLTWLASEVVAGIAVRRRVLLDRGIWRSTAEAVIQIVRRPISSAATVVLSYGASIVMTGLAIAATATAFDWCRVAARNQQPLSVTIGISPLSTTRDFRPAVFILAAMALALAWLVALALSGIAAAWRSAASTGDTAAAVPDTRASTAEVRLGLSSPGSERSGD